MDKESIIRARKMAFSRPGEYSSWSGDAHARLSLESRQTRRSRRERSKAEKLPAVRAAPIRLEPLPQSCAPGPRDPNGVDLNGVRVILLQSVDLSFAAFADAFSQ